MAAVVESRSNGAPTRNPSPIRSSMSEFDRSPSNGATMKKIKAGMREGISRPQPWQPRP
jgi:hypothetical protein